MIPGASSDSTSSSIPMPFGLDANRYSSADHPGAVGELDAFDAGRHENFRRPGPVFLAVNIVIIRIGAAGGVVVIDPQRLDHLPQIRTDRIRIGMFQHIGFGDDFGIVGVADKMHHFRVFADVQAQLRLNVALAVSRIVVGSGLLVGECRESGRQQQGCQS